MIVADGPVAFLAQDEFVSLLNRLTRHPPGGELAFNAYTTYAIWALTHTPAMSAIAGGVVNPGCNDPRQLERWAARLTLVEEISLTRAPEVGQLPLIMRLTSHLAARSDTASVRRLTAEDLLNGVNVGKINFPDGLP